MLLTTCTNCGAQFKVAPDQLNIRQGRVMCGRCRHVFNAFESLKRVDDDVPIETIEIKPRVEESPPATAPNPSIGAGFQAVDSDVEPPSAFQYREPTVPAELRASPVATPKPTPFATSFESPVREPAPDVDLSSASIVESAPTIETHSRDPEDFVAPLRNIDSSRDPHAARDTDDIDHADRADHASASNADADAKAAADANFASEIEALNEQIRSLDLNRSAPQPSATPKDLRAWRPVPAAETAVLEPETAPAPTITRVVAPQVDYYPPSTEVPTGNALLDTPAEEEASGPSRWWGVLAFLALLALVAQAAYVYRSEIVQRYPDLRGTFVNACQYLRCEVSWGRNEEAIRIEAYDLIEPPGRPGKILLTATLANRAATKQDFPLLQVTLNDTTERPITRRIFKPSEYLGRTTAPEEGMAPNAELYINLNLEVAGSTPASGFSLRAFYP